jgi:copper transport protein
LGGAVALLVLVGSASAAGAHASLVSTTPAQSEHFAADAPPSEVSVVFDSGVTATPDAIGVYDGAGKAVASKPVAGLPSTTIGATLPKLPDGTYVAVWHVVSDDGHPEHGAFTFGVGAGGASVADIDSLLASRSAGPAIGAPFDVDRALAFLASLVLVGGLVFTLWRWPEGVARREIKLLLLGSAALAFIATLASIPLQAAYAVGTGASALYDTSALGDVLAERFGRAAVLRLVLIGIAAALVMLHQRGRDIASRGERGLSVLVACGVVATFAYAGHGDTGRWPQLGFVTDFAHVGGAALWLGGVAVLALALRRRSASVDETESLSGAAQRFSSLALPAIALIVLSGVVQGWRQLGSLDALWTTTYGHLLAVKVLVVIAIVIVASAARDILRDRTVPAVRATIARARGSVVTDDSDTLLDLRNGVWVEAGLAVAVLLVTATLVVTQPGLEAEAAASRPTAHTVQIDAAGRLIAYTVAVQPALPGENTIVVTPRRTTQTGFLPAALGADVRPMNNPQSTPLTFTPLADGRFVTTAQLESGGEWNLDIAETAPSASTDSSASARFAIP